MDGNGHNPTLKAPQLQLPATTVQVVITFDQLTGAINVTGAIQNYVVFCGMVEAAKQVVQKYIEANQSPIARPGSLSLVRQ